MAKLCEQCWKKKAAKGLKLCDGCLLDGSEKMDALYKDAVDLGNDHMEEGTIAYFNRFVAGDR